MYDELIQRLYAHCNTDRSDAITNEAADAIAALSRVEAERDTANERGEYFREKADEEIKIRLNYGKELARVTAERDAAVADLHIPQDCRTCGNKTPWCNDNPDACKGYKWRGAQGRSEHGKTGNMQVCKAYQCELCDHLDVDDLTDKLFCRCGFWPGCGDPEGCKDAFRPVKGRGIIGAHR